MVVAAVRQSSIHSGNGLTSDSSVQELLSVMLVSLSSIQSHLLFNICIRFFSAHFPPLYLNLSLSRVSLQFSCGTSKKTVYIPAELCAERCFNSKEAVQG